MNFEEDVIVSSDVSLPMREFPLPSETHLPVEQLLQDYYERMTLNDGDLSLEETYAMSIKDSKYDATDPKTIADSCEHLTPSQREDLAKLLSKFPVLFDGKLKVFTDERVHLDIDPNVTPHRSRAYAVPHLHMSTFKKELDRLTEIGVLEKCG